MEKIDYAGKIQSLINSHQPSGWDLSFEEDSELNHSVHVSGIICRKTGDEEMGYAIAYEKPSKLIFNLPPIKRLWEIVKLYENIAKGLGAESISIDVDPSQVDFYKDKGYSFPPELKNCIAVKKLQ